MLTTQYRMHPSIMASISFTRIDCNVAFWSLTQNAPTIWQAQLSKNITILSVKTPAGRVLKSNARRLSNIREVDIIERLCQQMEAVGSRLPRVNPKKKSPSSRFYGAQLRKIDERLDSNIFLHFRFALLTASRAWSDPLLLLVWFAATAREMSDLQEEERVNVAFSRAQELLVIVGCHSLSHKHRGVGSIYCNVSDVVRSHEGFVDVSRILC